MEIDRLFDELMACDDATSRHLDNGAHYIRHQPGRGSLAFLHSLYPPAPDEIFDEVEGLIGPLPTEYRALLARANGLSLFEGCLNFYGYNGPLMNREIALEKREAISLAFQNKIFAAVQPELWSSGWICIGGASGWSSKISLHMHRDGRCAIGGEKGKQREVGSLSALLDQIMITFSQYFSCSGVLDPTYAELETSVKNLVQSH
jgi:hypothetical protein